MLGILLRTGQAEEAQKLVLESQFESLNGDLLRAVLEGFEGLEDSALFLGLEHRNSNVRLRAMAVLYSRGSLDIGTVERLSEDNDALVRNESVKALLSLGKQLDEKEVKKILVKPQKQAGLLGLGFFGRTAGAADKAGEEQFQRYQLDMLKSLSREELERKVESSLIHDDAAYFALMEKYFRNHAAQLRLDVDDRFGRYFEERIRRMKVVFGDSSESQDLLKKTRGLEDFLRKKLTRQGLNVLCAAQRPEDLIRIRANLRDGYAGASKYDAEYLAKNGEWNDVPMIANAEGAKLGETLLTMADDEAFLFRVARAITSIGRKHSISDLLSIDMPAAILKKTIELCPESRFAKISQDALLALFNHESDGVRKAAAILAVRAFTAKRIKSILHEYVGNDKYRYYNVIHWLDLGASMRRDYARKVALAGGN